MDLSPRATARETGFRGAEPIDEADAALNETPVVRGKGECDADALEE